MGGGVWKGGVEGSEGVGVVWESEGDMVGFGL